jgi:hypothetical protein
MKSEPGKQREREWLRLQQSIETILARHDGRVGNGRAYNLVREDLGTYEQKVLVFQLDAITAEIIQELCEALRDYSDEWRISLVEANADGNEVDPPIGLRLTAAGPILPKPLPVINVSPDDDKTTRALYRDLDSLLAAHGRSDASGHGDYWIIDDSWTPLSHKVSVFRIDFLTPELAREVQTLLRDNYPTCEIWFQIDVGAPQVNEIPATGIRIFPDRIEQDWDRTRLRAIFRERFKW